MADRTYKTDGINPINGEAVTEYPSVTTITRQEAKPFLIQAAVDVGMDYLLSVPWETSKDGVTGEQIWMFKEGYIDDARTEYRRKWDAAALFGTKVHAIAEYCFGQRIATGSYYLEDDPKVIYTTEDRVDGRVVYADHELIWDDLFRKVYKGLHDWCKASQIAPISTEEVVYGEGYAGRYDLVCKKKTIVTMIDVKTGAGSYHDDWKPQLSAYRQAFNKNINRQMTELNPDLIFPRFEMVQAHGFLKWNKKTEKWNYKDFSDDYEIDYAIFLTLRDLWWNKQIKKQLKKKGKKK